MKNMKLALLPMLLVLGLLMSGLAYAHWTQTIYVDGSVSSGILEVKVTSASHDDYGIDPGYDKDVGSTEVTFTDNRITVTIENAYPCYHVYVHFTVQNTGTIPVHFKGFGPSENFIYDPILQEWHASLFGGALTVWAWDSENEQIHPGGHKDYTIWIHVEQIAEQDHTYEFTVEQYFDQWNECDNIDGE